jgi:hypothetical protein
MYVCICKYNKHYNMLWLLLHILSYDMNHK